MRPHTELLPCPRLRPRRENMASSAAMEDVEQASASSHNGGKDTVLAPNAAVEAIDSKDPAAPSAQVSGKRQSLSDFFTIIAAGAGLASDGYVIPSVPI